MNFLFLSLLLSTTTLAIPQPRVADTPDCEIAPVYVCRDIDFSGNCELLHHCVGGGPDNCNQLDGQASSLGPDPGFTCNFYRTSNCDDVPGPSGGKLTLVYPGSGNLFNIQSENWNDAARSYECFRTGNATKKTLRRGV